MASAVVDRCSVYFNHRFLEDSLDQIPSKVPAPQRIGDIWARVAATFKGGSAKDAIPLLGRLGVSLADRRAHESLIPMMQMACTAGVKITPSKDDSGVYFLSKDGTKFAVFKVGTRRMITEALARKMAFKMGLERHVVPGVYCTIANPRLPNDEMSEELWNGNVKIYTGPQEERKDEPPTLTGILEPFISSDEKITADDIGSMTFLAFLLGLRDGKLDGMFGTQFVDVEDIMPLRLLPPPGQSPNGVVAASHVPFLRNPLARVAISPVKLEELSKSIDAIDSSVFELLADLQKEKVEYADIPSESLMAFKEDVRPPKEFKGKDIGIDHGGFVVQAVQEKQIMEDHPRVDISKTDSLVLKEQLLAFDDRVTSLKKFIDLCVKMEMCPSSRDLITNADQMYGAHLASLMKSDSRVAAEPFDVIGRFSPAVTGAPLSVEDRERILRASPPSVARSTSGSSVRNLFSGPQHDSPVSSGAEELESGLRRVQSEADLKSTISAPVAEAKMETE